MPIIRLENGWDIHIKFRAKGKNLALLLYQNNINLKCPMLKQNSQNKKEDVKLDDTEKVPFIFV